MSGGQNNIFHIFCLVKHTIYLISYSISFLYQPHFIYKIYISSQHYLHSLQYKKYRRHEKSNVRFHDKTTMVLFRLLFPSLNCSNELSKKKVYELDINMSTRSKKKGCNWIIGDTET